MEKIAFWMVYFPHDQIELIPIKAERLGPGIWLGSVSACLTNERL